MLMWARPQAGHRFMYSVARRKSTPFMWQGNLHWKLRNYKRVVVMEKTNARYVKSLPEQIDFATVDASFISLKVLMPVVKRWFSPPSPLPLGGGAGVRGE